MRRFEFPEEMLEIIHRERFHHPDPNVQRHMEVSWLKAHDETHARIATLSGRCRWISVHDNLLTLQTAIKPNMICTRH